MKAKILDGKKLALEILEDLKSKLNLKLRLAVVLVGENPVSKIYIHQKQKACEFVGIDFKLFKFPTLHRTEGSGTGLKKEIEKIVENPANSGVIVQLPLPKNLNTAEILNIIPAEKDIDVLSEKSLGKFYTGNSLILPPVVSGISHLLAAYNLEVEGKNVVIVGAGKLVGKPLSLWLLQKKVTLTILRNIFPIPRDISFFTKNADILISAVGKANLIKAAMVKKGAVVIDTGTTLEKGKLVGDVDFKSVSQKASYITPVPGGVGPMTVACLIENLMKLNKLK